MSVCTAVPGSAVNKKEYKSSLEDGLVHVSGLAICQAQQDTKPDNADAVSRSWNSCTHYSSTFGEDIPGCGSAPNIGITVNYLSTKSLVQFQSNSFTDETRVDLDLGTAKSCQTIRGGKVPD